MANHLDRIIITDLALPCIIGVEPTERKTRQQLLAQITLWLDIDKAARSDQLADTLDYKRLRDSVLQIAEASEFRLIESLCNRIASICLEQDIVRKVKVRLEKPAALRHARSVAVEVIRRRPAIALISVGSNIQPVEHIPAALALLMEKVEVLASSTFYQTEPVGPPGQPRFVNGVWMIKTDMSAWQLKNDILRRTEVLLGRLRCEQKDMPRNIDLDLLLYQDVVSTRPELPLPHPDLYRPFVLATVLELVDADEGPWAQLKALLPKARPPEHIGTRHEELTSLLRMMIKGQRLP